jgi:hypothetical protein
MSEFGELMYPAGTIILCEQGHRVAEVLRDLHRGEVGYATAIGNYSPDQTVPKRGDLLPLKCHCGAIWFAQYNRFVRTTR